MNLCGDFCVFLFKYDSYQPLLIFFYLFVGKFCDSKVEDIMNIKH